MAIINRKIAFIGGGHITEIIVSNMLNNNTLTSSDLYVSDPDKNKTENLKNKFRVNICKSNIEAVIKSDFIFVCVLPQTIDDVLVELGDPGIWKSKILISVVAGISIRKYSQLYESLPVVRALPNPGSKVDEGVIAIAFNEFVDNTTKLEIRNIFNPMGMNIIMEERDINIMTSLSSPVMVYRFIKALTDAGENAGLDRTQSEKIVIQTILGSLKLYEASNIGLEELLLNAQSPGGISEQCIMALDKYKFDDSLNVAVQMGFKKAEDFSK